MLVLAAQASAQTGFIAGTVHHNWMGFQHFAPTIGVDASSPRFSNTLWWSSAAKSYVGNGWALWEQGAAYFNRGSFGVGPAVLVRYTSNSQFTKTSFYPSIALQSFASGWRVEGMIHLRDPWTGNHGRGASLVVRREITSPESRLRAFVRTGVTIMKFSDGLSDPYGSVVQAGIVIVHRPLSR